MLRRQTRASAASDPSSGPMTIGTCLRALLASQPPPMFTSKIASSTRGLTAFERGYLPHEQLQWLASFSDFVFIARRKLEALPLFQTFSSRELDPTNPDDSIIMHLLHPEYTGQIAVPPELRSEADTTSHINTKFIWPACKALQLMLKLQTPYASSSNGKRNLGIPDLILVYQDIEGLGEWKTSNAMPKSTFAPILDYLRGLASLNLGVPARFWWPNDDDVAGQPSPFDETWKFRRIMCQLWGQLALSLDVAITCVSSLDTTIFFFRHPGEPNFLFVSDAIPFEEASVMDFMAMFALCIGITKLDKKDLPSLNQKNFRCLEDYYKLHPQMSPGLDMRINLTQIIAGHRRVFLAQADAVGSRKRKGDTATTPTSKKPRKSPAQNHGVGDVDNDLTPRPAPQPGAAAGRDKPIPSAFAIRGG